ncbi:MAG: 4Fe-4S binding protein, partial [Candidatus Bathyarchaeia archaeon]
ITRREDDSPEVDYDYCKGCGICANECPVKAIAMQREEE